MKKIKKGDIVGRISYGKDIFFIVDRILKLKNNTNIAILKGLTVRIKADSLLEDLELINSTLIKENINKLDNKINLRLNNLKNDDRKYYKYGKVLHLDGDSRYAQKSVKYYRNAGINAIVKNVPESRQPNVLKMLLEKSKPDILVITGHDGMIKGNSGFNDVYNYRNSLYFIKCVNIAREWENYSGNLAIFARGMSKLLWGINSEQVQILHLHQREF